MFFISLFHHTPLGKGESLSWILILSSQGGRRGTVPDGHLNTSFTAQSLGEPLKTLPKIPKYQADTLLII